MKKIILFSIIVFLFFNVRFENTKKQETIVINENEIKNFPNELYEKCLSSPFKGEEINIDIKTTLLEYQSIGISFSFEDIKNNYSFGLKEDQIYYGASIIKLLEAIYLIEKSRNNEIYLEEELTYKSYHQKNYSLEMEKKHFGDKVKIKDLIYYILSVSDNTAHEMIIEFIGINHLKQFARKLGITLTINEWDHYGNLSSKDGLKILSEVYKILNLKNEYSDLLKSSMKNNYYNSLNFENKIFFHKYGFYDIYYHDIGIYENNNPYLISIFTTKGLENYKKIVKELNKKIYQIYEKNIKKKEEYCLTLKRLISYTF